ncbi:UNVERIFIED_CONTAM: Appr-1-p processing protein, partial [Pseudomonas aeruginosa]
MIREVEGDILLSGAQVIAHGIAPQDHFDSGLALALRERWPSMVRDYRHAA